MLREVMDVLEFLDDNRNGAEPFAALLPDDLKPLSTEGPTQGSIQGNQVVFQPLPRLAPKADTTFTVRAQGVHPGDQRVQVQIQSDDLKTPVTKEESTKVYSDR